MTKHNFLDYNLYYMSKRLKKDEDSEDDKILGMDRTVFLSVFAINFLLYITAIILLIKHWKKLESWAQMLGIIGLIPIIPGGCLLTLVVVIA